MTAGRLFASWNKMKKWQATFRIAAALLVVNLNISAKKLQKSNQLHYTIFHNIYNIPDLMDFKTNKKMITAAGSDFTNKGFYKVFL